MEQRSNTENDSEEVSINPCPPEWLDNDDNALLRGDAIGDTVYTHRWILKCLSTITESLPKYLKNEKNPEDSSNQNEKNPEDSSNQNEKNPEDSSNQNKKNTEDSSNQNEKNLEDSSNQKEKNPKDSSNQNETTENPDVKSIEKNLEKDKDAQVYDTLSQENKVLELDSDVEDAACQLWDMTAEKDVALHLLNLKEIDILQLATVIFDNSYAPRLTEVMVGIVANLCCDGQVCDKVLKKEESETLLSALRLMGSTSDVPTLCELMRLIRLLLWHRVHRTPNTCWASCPLLKLLCQEYYRTIITFLLHNSLSDNLISNILELLSNFLFICLPETGLNVASLYSTEEIISGLIDVLDRKCFHLQKHLDDEKQQILHLVILCLYAFIDTPGARLIQLSASDADSKLEAVLLSYIEHEGRVECPEELIGDVCDRLIRIIGLSQLLIPTMKLPSLILTVGKLIAHISGETQQYSVSRSQSREDENECNKEKDSYDIFRLDHRPKKKRKSMETKASSYTTPVSNPLVEEGGWLSPPAVSPLHFRSNEVSPVKSAVSSLEYRSTEKLPYEKLVNSCNNIINAFHDEEKSKARRNSTSPDLKELKEHLEDFCYQLIAYWWSESKEVEGTRRTEAQKVILDVLDQCHAHEVFLILNAVRMRDTSLVPKLQEQILDSGSHQRLVALLAHMYQ